MNELRRFASDLTGVPKFTDLVSQHYPNVHLPNPDAQIGYILLLSSAAGGLLLWIYSYDFGGIVQKKARLSALALLLLVPAIILICLQRRGGLDFILLWAILEVALVVVAVVALLGLVLGLCEWLVPFAAKNINLLLTMGKVVSVIVLFPLLEEVVFRCALIWILESVFQCTHVHSALLAAFLFGMLHFGLGFILQPRLWQPGIPGVQVAEALFIGIGCGFYYVRLLDSAWGILDVMCILWLFHMGTNVLTVLYNSLVNLVCGVLGQAGWRVFLHVAPRLMWAIACLIAGLICYKADDFFPDRFPFP